MLGAERWVKLGRAVDAAYLSHKQWAAIADPTAGPVEQWIDAKLGDIGDDLFELIYKAAGVPHPTDEAGKADGGPSPPAEEG